MWISRKRYNDLKKRINNASPTKTAEDNPEADMKKRLEQLFITLSEKSKTCEACELPAITSAMLEIYKKLQST